MTSSIPSLDLPTLRQHFPAISSNPDYVFAENAGGSQVLGSVASTISDYLLNTNVQMANYDLAFKAKHRVSNGTSAAAFLLGARHSDEVMLGSSATQLVETLSRLIESTIHKQREGSYQGGEEVWREGDEIIVSQADHETNRGAWCRLAERAKLKVKVWPVTRVKGSEEGKKYNVTLDPAVLEDLVNDRTRLVAFTACSNLLGEFTDVKKISEMVKSKSSKRAWVCVDCVAFSPHRRVVPREWGVDFAFFSFYKLYGPHVGAIWLSPRAQRDLLGKLGHFFLNDLKEAGTYPYQPSSVQYELNASCSAVADYLVWLGQGCQGGIVKRDWVAIMGSTASSGYVDGDQVGKSAQASLSSQNDTYETLSESLDLAFKAISKHEGSILETLMSYLLNSTNREKRGLEIVGLESASSILRAPTVSFVVKGVKSREIHQRIVQGNKMGAQQGHMYAYRLIESLGLDLDDGVVRVSFVHYNTLDEVERFCQALEEALNQLCPA
ncbi:PLP-dependent transferase [Violaceomyces palustris]|uniref:PLP-dependent transferase n=1 Tax=Violaceomyces palustris TaxID=1673888 RepID=A0ACD0NZW1_9BASI|nr:PLP-dependent transferase [Violaceomyces palustris]